jgi:hypothetical protein
MIGYKIYHSYEFEKMYIDYFQNLLNTVFKKNIEC